jgi:APA family basic amino acid/polyamine antiporter
MLQLPKITWIRFGLWLVVGLVIYFFYGTRNSRLGKIAAGVKAN